MRLEVLLSCMHQTDASLIQKLGISGDAVIINQSDREEYAEFVVQDKNIRMHTTRERGLTKSRNMAIAMSRADICLLCDDDERLCAGYEEIILKAYEMNPRADVLIFRVRGLYSSLGTKACRLRFPKTMKVSSVQISFRRESLLKAGVGFDPLLGAGSGNGAEEELKFLLDCQRAGLRIFYVPQEIASLQGSESTWFTGFDTRFFENRGTTTRYILGPWLAALYAFYYVLRKRKLYGKYITPAAALRATLRGIRRDAIGKKLKSEKQES